MIYRVAVNAPLWSLLDYQSPQELACGQIVRVPLGRRQVYGVITATVDSSEFSRLKPITAAVDLPPLPLELLALLAWCWRYYHHPPGEVVAAALPPALATAAAGNEQWYALAPALQQNPQALDDALAACCRAPRQRELLSLLAHSLQAESTLNAHSPGWRGPMKRLLHQQWVITLSHDDVLARQTTPNSPPGDAPGADAPRPATQAVQLRAEQTHAVQQILNDPAEYCAWLLEGVTGSGKTEVYLHAAQYFLAQGKQVLILVPEIGLTPQTLHRVRQSLGCEVGEYHSGLADGARREIWRRVAQNQLQVVVGTRSAVFLPFTRLGFIALDEEHDASYKQQEGFHYSARDVAVMRAHRLAIPIVLGSATPALESLANIQRGRYHKLELHQRHGQDAHWELLDVRGLRASLFAPAAVQAMRETLAAGGQVMVFRNRRGYAPVWMCGDCGWAARCLRCDTHMTLHQSRHRLICHHCGAEQRLSEHCPGCDSDHLLAVGQGTERLEEALLELFPDTPVHRVDRDRMRKRNAMGAMRETILSGQPCILVGTQMLAKGHDFPTLDLVLVVDADQALHSVDFRAPERLGQLLVQVAGRAGRGSRPGKVLIQTRQPEHPLLQTLLRGGYPALAAQLLRERRATQLPPYSAQLVLRADALTPEPPRQWLEQVRQQLQQQTARQQQPPAPGTTGSPQATAPADAIRLQGPMPALMERRAGRWRWQLYLQSSDRAWLNRFVEQHLPTLRELPITRQIRWRVDVDPYEF